jgi:hypothetical protein
MSAGFTAFGGPSPTLKSMKMLGFGPRAHSVADGWLGDNRGARSVGEPSVGNFHGILDKQAAEFCQVVDLNDIMIFGMAHAYEYATQPASSAGRI